MPCLGHFLPVFSTESSDFGTRVFLSTFHCLLEKMLMKFTILQIKLIPNFNLINLIFFFLVAR